MEKYSYIKIGKLGKVVTGKTPKTSIKENYGNEYMFIGPSDLHNHYFIKQSVKSVSKLGISSVKGSIIEGISVLVGCIGWDMGNVGIVNAKCVTNQQINSITNFDKEYNPFYVYYWLKSKKSFLFDTANVTRTPILNKTDFSNIAIPMPPKEYQDKVSTMLENIDKKIRLNMLIIEKLEEIAKHLYNYWFTQFDFPDELGRPYKSNGGRLVWNNVLNKEIPQNWEVTNLKANPLVELLKPGIHQFSGTKTYLATADVNNNVINFLADKITFDNRESRANMEPKPNSIWFAKMKKSKKLIFVAEYSKLLLENFIFSTGFVGLYCIKSFALEYVWQIINNDNFELLKDRLANGATQEAINNDSLAFIPLIVPPDRVLEEFHSKVFQIYKEIYNAQVENYRLLELRDWLIPMLMNGQILLK